MPGRWKQIQDTEGGEVGIWIPRHLEAMVSKAGIFKALLNHTPIIAGRECYCWSSKDWGCGVCNGKCGIENGGGRHPQRCGGDEHP
jgi:hypothetical protein